MAPKTKTRAEAARDSFWRPEFEEAVGKLAATYRSQYDFRVEKPLAIEVFPEQKWLSARSIGLPYAPFLGVCFGSVVSVDSPLVRDVKEEKSGDEGLAMLYEFGRC